MNAAAEPGESWRRLRAAFDELVELEAEARAARLAAIEAADPAAARELAELLSHAAEDDFLERPALDRVAGASEAPSRIGPWRLEREIGRGGMGVVWRAVRDDGAFEQTVAIKLVRPELASELLRRRLVDEMRILAALEHEAIARLIDGGATADGIPYLVLEYVSGSPIDVHCDERALSLPERLRMFREVCGAVEFAHRRLVLHRDLKSSNLLVDERGRPKLLDFGIAKLLGGEARGEEWTALGFERPLTPEWASPEQLRGEELTTASDVYSLGVLLHVLVAGTRPHRWTGQRPEEFAREIERSGDAARSLARRELAPGVERRAVGSDLAHVVSKALAPEVGERYGSAAALGAEIDRYLAGRPVEAHPPSALYRARRYLARHRAAALAVAVAAASLVVATAVSLRQARIAQRERERAEQRFGEVRQLANRFLFDFEESIRELPGSTPARERVVATAREYLDSLAADSGNDAALLDELAQAYLKVGDLEGHPRKANLGRPERAQASYEAALAIGRKMTALEPRKSAGWAHAGTAELRLGDLALDRDDFAEAESRSRSALASFETALEERPDDRELARYRGQALQRIGSVALARGEYAAAKDALEKYRAACLAALDAAPDARESARDALVASILLGDVWDEWGKPAEALPLFEDALRRAERQRETQPGVSAERDWTVALQRVIIALRKLGRHEEALPKAEAGLAWSESAWAADPENSLLKRDTAESVADLGRELAALGRWQEALGRFERSRRLFEELAAAEPESGEVQGYFASALYLEAEALERTGQKPKAEAKVRRGSTLESALVESSPDDAELQESLAASLRLLGRLELDRGAVAAARTSLDRAVALEERLTASAGRSAERDAALAESLFWRGRSLSLEARLAAACLDFLRAAALVGDEPLDASRLPAQRLRAAVAGCSAAPG